MYEAERGSSMKFIVGLGNPGKKYKKTRHNIGFEAVEELASMWQLSWKKSKWKSETAETMAGGEKVILVKPVTYMNLSGEAVGPMLDFYKAAPEDILVVYDDLDLAPGTVRLRKKGGHGGHNGIRSLIEHLGTKEFKRLRIGIGKPEKASVIDYVLGTFPPGERKQMDEAVKKAAASAEAWSSKSFDEVMNEFN
ncbi:peptidyl-tRNA hydrolase [Marinococcus halophilus]|uniref:Peptidyl-tRNA hydrolase n=2 Tax=Marinococcus halophilus TaxID=1371 RepID=A0A510Y9F3_MARHA|nr:peptidyl-tRNA hydrolase [Marinococcus halophilus]